MRKNSILLINKYDLIGLKTIPSTPNLEYTRKSLIDLKTLPPMTKCLTRDFIHNSLYNPDYGYFSSRADIFTLEKDINFNKLFDTLSFSRLVDKFYSSNDGKWHTPTELFQPAYGFVIANYIIQKYINDPRSSDLKIYEIGGGNGTLMKNILTFIKQRYPLIFEKTSYSIIDISSKLSSKQANLSQFLSKTKIINKSIFDYNEVENESCFVLATELIDNFAHDLITRDSTNQILQGIVLIDQDLDFVQAFEDISDPLIKRYLSILNEIGYKFPVSFKKRLRDFINPFYTEPDTHYIPTQQLLFFDVLDKCFPRHRLILSDFSDLQTENTAPIVQTVYNNDLVVVPTYIVQPGWFDIFFPTDFELLKKLYLSGRKRNVEIMTQESFLKTFGTRDILDITRTRIGENPMLSFYKNFKFCLVD